MKLALQYGTPLQTNSNGNSGLLINIFNCAVLRPREKWSNSCVCLLRVQFKGCFCFIKCIIYGDPWKSLGLANLRQSIATLCVCICSCNVHGCIAIHACSGCTIYIYIYISLSLFYIYIYYIYICRSSRIISNHFLATYCLSSSLRPW